MSLSIFVGAMIFPAVAPAVGNVAEPPVVETVCGSRPLGIISPVAASRPDATQSAAMNDGAGVSETAVTPPEAEAVATGWEPALAALRRAVKEAPIKEIDNEASRNVLTSLLPNCKTRIFRVSGKGRQRQYVLRKGDERIYQCGNADDVLALAKAKNVVLSDEQKIKSFGGLLSFGDRVIKRSQRQWELHFQLSGRPGVSFRVLTLDEENRPVAVGPAEYQPPFVRREKRVRPPAASDAGESRKPPTRPEDARQAIASFQTYRITFRAKVESVELLSKYTGTVIRVDRDPRYVMVVSVQDVDQQKVPIQAGRKKAFAIHSPAKLIGRDEQAVGKTYRFTITRHTGPPASFSNLRVADDPPPPDTGPSQADRRPPREPRLVLWNILGSAEDIQHSKVGPSGTIHGQGVSFVSGKRGKGLTSGHGKAGPNFGPWEKINPEYHRAGTVEFWWKPARDYDEPNSPPDEIFVSGKWQRPWNLPFQMLYRWRENKGCLGGFDFQVADGQRQQHYLCTGKVVPFKAGDWLHVAFAWDMDGLPNDRDVRYGVFVNGEYYKLIDSAKTNCLKEKQKRAKPRQRTSPIKQRRNPRCASNSMFPMGACCAWSNTLPPRHDKRTLWPFTRLWLASTNSSAVVRSSTT